MNALSIFESFEKQDNLTKKDLYEKKEANKMYKKANAVEQDPFLEASALAGGVLGGISGAGISGLQSLNKERAEAIAANTRGLPQDVVDAYKKSYRGSVLKEMASSPGGLLGRGVMASPLKALGGYVGGSLAGAVGYGAYQVNQMDKQANYENILEKQREIVEMQRALAERREQVESLAANAEAASQQYSQQPHEYGKRLAVLGGAVGAGAGIGALASRSLVGALPGAALGGIAGMAAQPIISHQLDQKYPGRVEARENMNEAQAQHSQMQGRYMDEKKLRNLAIGDAAQAGVEHPSLYAKAVREVGDEFPIREVNNEIAKLRSAREELERQELEMRRLAIEEKKAVIRGTNTSTDLTQEQVMKAQMKNYQRAEKMMNQE